MIQKILKKQNFALILILPKALVKKKEKYCGYKFDSTCGGIQSTETKQCAYFPYYCKEVTVDEYCYFDSGNCKKRDNAPSDFDDTNYMCVEGKTNSIVSSCLRTRKACNLFSLSKCQTFDKSCYQVDGFDVCKTVTVHDNCQIKEGKCIEKSGNTAIQKCAFDSEKNNCKPENKKCSEVKDTSKCSETGVISNSGNQCQKVIIGGVGKCQEVTKDSLCSITDGACDLTTPDSNTKNECQFVTLDESRTKCQLYEVNKNCALSAYLVCSGEDKTQKKICEFTDSAHTKCQPNRKKACTDYTTKNDCEGDTDNIISDKTSTKCSWKEIITENEHHCQQYTFTSPCTVTNGECTGTDEEKKLCIFDYNNKLSCSQKPNTCENHYENCHQVTTSEGKGCIQIEGRANCKEISLDEKCQINANGCTYKTDLTNQVCELNDAQTSCEVRNLKCYESTDKTYCNTLDNCYLFTDFPSSCKETETDNNCVVENNECKKRSDKTLTVFEECKVSISESSNNKAVCKKVQKTCGSLGQTDCNNAPLTGNNKYQCQFMSNYCHNVTLDEKCKMESGSCKENGNGKLGSNEVCELSLDSHPYYCRARDKSCSDFTDKPTCSEYTTDSPLCFYIGNSCKEVKIDSQCSINENNECTGSGCKFDNDNNRCFYTKNNGYSLKLKRFLLLVLAFML